MRGGVAVFKDGPTPTVVTQHISRRRDCAESVPCEVVLERTLATSNALNKRKTKISQTCGKNVFILSPVKLFERVSDVRTSNNCACVRVSESH